MQEQMNKVENDKIKIENNKIEEEKAVREKCHSEAVDSAGHLLKTKSELSGGNQYKEAVEKDLYLKDDFDKFYEDCLSVNGLKK
jgi:hypothetical protein